MSYCISDNTYFDGAISSVLIIFIRSAFFSDQVTYSLTQPAPPSASDRRVWCHAITKLVQSSITDTWVKEAQKYVTPTRLASGGCLRVNTHWIVMARLILEQSPFVLILLYLGNTEYYNQSW